MNGPSLHSWIPHLLIQPTLGHKYSGKKFQKVPKAKVEFAAHQQVFIYNLHDIYMSFT